MTTPYKYQSYVGYVGETETQHNLNKLIQEMGITEITPTKPQYGGITRAGLFSFCGFIGEVKVKVYSTFTNEQADLRISMNTLSLSCAFPEVIGRRGNVLVDSWITGQELSLLLPNKDLTNRVVTFMTELKSVDVDNLCEYAFDYFDYFDYLMVRCENSGVGEIEQLRDFWKNTNIDSQAMLCHNDLFDDNLIFDGEHLYVVDHEMLGISKFWFLSWKNSFMEKHNIHPDGYYGNIPHNYIKKAWLLRKTGTRLLKERT